MDGKRGSKLTVAALLPGILFIWLLFIVAGEAAQVTVVNKGDAAISNVALTFDVEGGSDVVSVLKTLKRYKIKGTFFLLGTWVEANPELAGQIVSEGHEIGNHTYSHPQLTKLNKEQIIQEIKKGEKIIKDTTGISPKPFFRPPYGAVDSTVVQAIGEAGYSFVSMWSLDPQDWTGKPAAQTVAHVLNNLHKGAIILLHLNKTNTPAALPILLEEMLGKGYQFASLSQLTFVSNQEVADKTEQKAVTVASKDNSNNGVKDQVFKNPPQLTVKVNNLVVNMSSNPQLIANRSFVPVRDIAGILGGDIYWDNKNKQVILTIGSQSFQFEIGGVTRFNGELIPAIPGAVLVDNRAMIPLYLLSEKLNMPINWESKTRTVNLALS